MNENKEFKPYIPADKVTPELTAVSVIIGVLLAVVFGAANAYLGLRVGLHSCGGYLHGRYPRPDAPQFHSGEQYRPDDRFRRRISGCGRDLHPSRAVPVGG